MLDLQEKFMVCMILSPFLAAICYTIWQAVNKEGEQDE